MVSKVNLILFFVSTLTIWSSIHSMHVCKVMRPLVNRVLNFVSNYYINSSNLLYYSEYDPKKMLYFMQSIHAQFAHDVRKHNLDALNDLEEAQEKYVKLVKYYEYFCPLFLLGECAQEDFGYCMLSRAHNSLVRKFFEQAVSTVLKEKLTQNPDKPVYYTTFGCGGLFQDLVIITKTLLQNPNAQLIINIIDRNYTPYVGCCDILGITRDITSGDNLELGTFMDKIKEHARQEWIIEDVQGDFVEREITLQTTLLRAKFQQFMSWFAKHFPQGRISCFVHESAQSYLEYCACHTMPVADITVAADIEDEISLLCDSTYDYMYLCIKIMQQKQDSSNLLLTRGAGKPSIMNLSLCEQKEYNVITNLKVDDTSIPVYAMYTPIH